MSKDKKIFYIYEWFNIKTNEVFYVGKGCGDRYKNKKDRNKDFLTYIKNNPVDVRIVWTGEDEQEAYQQEIKYTEKYKKINQCSCNLAKPGYGGYQQQWTPELREYMSKNNPMKSQSQRERMKKNNPMKNKEISKKVGQSHKRKIIIGEKEFDGLIDAGKIYKVHPTTISNWLKKGINPKGEKCYYYGDNNNSKITKRGQEVIVDGVKYHSIAAAAKAINVASSSLRSALLENRKCKNHICKYANQQPSQ